MRENHCAIIKNKNNKILFTVNKGTYTLPGGKRDDNENALKCLMRELKEELGTKIVIKEINLLKTFKSFSLHDEIMEFNYYEVKLYNVEDIMMTEEIDGIVWENDLKCLRKNISIPTAIILNDYFLNHNHVE